MPRRKSTTTKAVGQDAKGRYFKNLGFVKTAAGKYSQKKFYLGSDEDFAQLAAARLKSLWKCVCEHHEALKVHAESCVFGGPLEIDRQSLNLDTTASLDSDGQVAVASAVGRSIWSDLTLCLAEAIRQGHPVAKIPLATITSLPEFRDQHVDSHYTLAPWLDRVRVQFPVIHIEIDDPQLQLSTQGSLDEKASELLAEGKRLSAEPLTNQKLHHGIETYKSSLVKEKVDAEGETSEWARTKGRQIQFVSDNTDNLDLSQLGGPSINSILQILSKRPFTKKGNPCSIRHAQNCIKEFRKFLEWLDTVDSYNWSWPDRFEYKAPKVIKNLPDSAGRDNPVLKIKKRTYNVAELKTLYEFAEPIQRLYMLVGLNCGFGNAELTSLQTDEIFLSQVHPNEDLLELGPDASDSWIARTRVKTNVLGTWKLWPETIKAIEWWQEERDQIEAAYASKKSNKIPFDHATKSCFLVTQNWKPVAPKNRRTGRIPNSWNALTKRITEHHPKFKQLSFGKLRKTGATIVRKLSNAEIASIYLAHGSPYGDDKDLEAYAERPYAQLFDVQDNMHEHLKPLWDAVPTPFDRARRRGGKSNLSLEQLKSIDQLLDKGLSAKQVAEKLSINVSTVYRRRSK